MKKLSLVLALLLMFSCFAFAAAETEATAEKTPFETARDIYRSGDYAAALPLFEELSAAGDMAATGYLGDYYAKGLLGEVDFAKAAELYMKATAGGDVFSAATLLSRHDKNEIPAEAIDFAVVRDALLAKQETFTGEDKNDAIYLFWIGHSYEKGLFSEDFAPDYVNGYTYYLRAAELGQTNAMHDMAGNYLSGNYTEGVPDPEKALEWYQKAYEGNHSCATTHIFLIYKDGVTAGDGTVLVAPDEEKAYAYLEQVFAEGKLDNWNNMRDKLIAHLESAETPDYAHILEIWKDAADKGDAYAAIQACVLLKDGKTAEDGTVLLEKDLAQAVVYFEKAYANGSTDLYVLEWLGHFVAGASDVMTPDHARAVEIFEQAFANGSTFAAERLAYYYSYGKTADDGTVIIEKDPAKALPCLEAAYAAGTTDTTLLSLLGYYLRGNEDVVTADHVRALEVFTKAADLGDRYSAERVANYYCAGETADDGAVIIEKDLAKALPYLETAYAAGTEDTYLLSMLGYILSVDEISPADPVRALEVQTKAADLNNLYSCEYVGKTYLKDTTAGDGAVLIAKDYEKALLYLRRAYENGTTDSYILSWLAYFATTGTAMEVDDAFAAEIYTILSEQGDVDASGHLAYYYLLGVTKEDGTVVIEKDYAKALPYLQIAVDAGTEDTYMLSMMGYFLCGNDGWMEADYAKAVEVYQKGADLGDGYCWAQLGAIYENGQYGDADAAKAIECYQKAVDLGYTDVQTALDNLKAQ